MFSQQHKIRERFVCANRGAMPELQMYKCKFDLCYACMSRTSLPTTPRVYYRTEKELLLSVHDMLKALDSS